MPIGNFTGSTGVTGSTGYTGPATPAPEGPSQAPTGRPGQSTDSAVAREKQRVGQVNKDHQAQHDTTPEPGRTTADVVVNPVTGPQEQPVRDDKEQDKQAKLNADQPQAQPFVKQGNR